MTLNELQAKNILKNREIGIWKFDSHTYAVHFILLN